MNEDEQEEISTLVKEITEEKQINSRQRFRLLNSINTLYAALPNIDTVPTETAKDLIEDLAINVLYRVHDPRTVREISETLQDPRYKDKPEDFELSEAEARLVIGCEEDYATWREYLSFLESRVRPETTPAFMWKQMNAVANDYARILMICKYEEAHGTQLVEIAASKQIPETKKAS
jgi:hypothetical protein